MRRVLQVCGVAAAVAALVGASAPDAGAQVVSLGGNLPPITVVVSPVMPGGVAVAVPHAPGVAGIGVGIGGSGASSGRGHVVQKDTSSVEPASIVLSE